MKIPISKRLLCCTELIPPGARVADIGTDHGYLSIYLIKNNLAASVIAADLRQMPLENARQNACRFGVAERIKFVLSDGLEKIESDSIDTIVCAGMGGDLIAMILQAAPWLCDSNYTVIVQPQSTVHELRRWLAETGFRVEEERLVRDGGFLYPVMRLRFDKPYNSTPGRHFVPEHLNGQAQFGAYLLQMRNNLRKTVDGLSRAKAGQDMDKLDYYSTALTEVEQMRVNYGICE